MIKFQAKVNQGKIEIPEIYQDNLQSLKNVSSGIIDRLLKHPIKIQDFTSLSRDEIYKR